VRCSVLQRVAACCSMVQCVAEHFRVTFRVNKSCLACSGFPSIDPCSCNPRQASLMSRSSGPREVSCLYRVLSFAETLSIWIVSLRNLTLCTMDSVSANLRAYKDWAVEGRGQDPAILSKDSVEGREPVTSQIWPEFTVRSFPTLKDGEFQHLSTCEFVPRPFQ